MMKISTIKLNVTALAILLTTSLFMPHVVAAPGTIATQPLQTSASAESNVMFVLDSSGSMKIISPETFTHVFTCSVAGAKLAAGTTVDLNINSGEPEIINITASPDVTRSWGNNASSYCFDPTKFYTARLNTDTGSTWGRVEYKGDYLNWYFDSSNDGTANWVEYKPTAKTRMQVAQVSLNGLLDTLKSVNVGLTTFDTTAGSKGASIINPIAAINASNLADLQSSVTAAVPDGGTPLAETLRDIGRYFASGDGNNGSTSGQCGGKASTDDLYLYPDDVALTTSAPCDDFFNSSYTKDTDATGKGPVEFFCQKNFAVMLTDGFPTNDDDLSSYLKDYDKDCTAAAQTAGSYTCDSADDTKSYDDSSLTFDYWDDVAQALHDIDLRPDLNNQQGNPHKNNLSTYTVGFADKQIKDLQLIKDTATQGGGESYYAEDSDDLVKILNDINAEIEGQSGTAAAVTFNSSTLSSQSAVYQALFNTQRWSGRLRSIPLDGFTGAVLVGTCTDAVAEAGTMDNCWNAEYELDNQTSRTILTYNPVSQRGVDFAYNTSSQDYTTITSSGTTSEIIPKTMIDDFCDSHDIPFPCDLSTAADSVKVASNMAYMSDLVDYLRGDRTHEADNTVGADGTSRDFRRRAHKLGDIVNSSPVYVGKPSLGWPAKAPFPIQPDIFSGDTDYSYNTWTNSDVKNRAPVVYVAANDGMLHGFRAQDSDPAGSSNDAGQEVFAFIPSATANTGNNAGLHYLANPNYQHYFYVDLNPALSDVYINHRDGVSGSPTGSDPLSFTTREWRTVIVGGQGAGGNTMFMLDVTEPGIKAADGTVSGSHFSAANVKELVEWEFSHPNLGYTYSKPTIAMMNNGRFAAIFGNGYNSSDNLPTAGDCQAKLFVVFLDGTGVDGVWNVGTDPSLATTDYMEFDTATGAPGDCNGLSSPSVVDLNSDGVADKAYAGDMYGNLWAFDLCNESAGVCTGTGWGLAGGGPIMTAKNDSGQRQPITVKPVISIDPSIAGTDNLIIAFGTGQYLANGDITSNEVQTFYGVRHGDAFTDGGNFGLDPRNAPNKFVEQEITEIPCTQTGCIGDVRTITDNSIGNNAGWYVDFDFADAAAGTSNLGERIVVNPKIRNNTLFFNTVIPDSTKCNAGGNGWLMSINLANGGRPLAPVFDLNNDGVFDSDDQEGGENPAGQKVFAIPAESTFLGDNQYTPDSEGNISKRKVNIGTTNREGRMSWKELFEEI